MLFLYILVHFGTFVDFIVLAVVYMFLIHKKLRHYPKAQRYLIFLFCSYIHFFFPFSSMNSLRVPMYNKILLEWQS